MNEIIKKDIQSNITNLVESFKESEYLIDQLRKHIGNYNESSIYETIFQIMHSFADMSEELLVLKNYEKKIVKEMILNQMLEI